MKSDFRLEQNNDCDKKNKEDDNFKQRCTYNSQPLDGGVQPYSQNKAYSNNWLS